MTTQHCIYALSEEGYTYRRAIRGLRGKRRQAFKLGVARAATMAEAVYKEAAKDKSIPKLLALHKRYHAKQKKVQDDYRIALTKITDAYHEKAVEIRGSITHHSLNYAVTRDFLEQTIAEPGIRKLCTDVEVLGKTLATEQQAAAKAQGHITECGVRLPRAMDAKKVLADPALKALIDGIGKEGG